MTMYQKPALEKFGSFRELTRWGFNSASDGGSIFGIGSTGCQTTIGRGRHRTTISIGCPTANVAEGPTTS